MEGARKLGERNWRNRGSWQKLLKKVLAQKRLCANDDDDDDVRRLKLCYFVYYGLCNKLELISIESNQ